MSSASHTRGRRHSGKRLKTTRTSLRRQICAMQRTVYHVEQMDCAAEERLIRMQLEDVAGVERLEFDLPERRLAIYHNGTVKPAEESLTSLDLGARRVGDTETVEAKESSEQSLSTSKSGDKQPLVIALAINFTFFVGEMTAGLLAGSMGLVADSLDMLADSSVYALSLAAVGTATAKKKKLARWSGYLQLGLALLGLLEVTRRFFFAREIPDVTTMVVVASLALLGNIATLYLLNRSEGSEAHMQASKIFTSNDIKVNALVIISSGLVWWTASRIPDLLAGGLIFVIVANGARRIFAISK